MEVEGFYQCLTYVQSIHQESGYLQLLKTLAPIGGVIVGFILSSLASRGASRRAEKRKAQSVKTEVKLVKASAERTLSEAVLLLRHTKTEPKHTANFSPSLDVRFLLSEALLPQVCFLFSENQIQKMYYAFGYAADMNERTDWVIRNLRDSRPSAEFTAQLYALADIAACVVCCCGDFLADTTRDHVRTDVVVSSLDIPDEVVSSVYER